MSDQWRAWFDLLQPIGIPVVFAVLFGLGWWAENQENRIASLEESFRVHLATGAHTYAGQRIIRAETELIGIHKELLEIRSSLRFLGQYLLRDQQGKRRLPYKP